MKPAWPRLLQTTRPAPNQPREHPNRTGVPLEFRVPSGHKHTRCLDDISVEVAASFRVSRETDLWARQEERPSGKQPGLFHVDGVVVGDGAPREAWIRVTSVPPRACSPSFAVVNAPLANGVANAKQQIPRLTCATHEVKACLRFCCIK